MALNWEATETQWFVDQANNMMLEQGHGEDLGGRGDAIGRSFIAYYVYGDERFLEGIENCWVKKKRHWIWRLFGKKYYYQGYRYPTHDHKTGLSRDHLTYTILAYKYAGYSNEALKEFIKNLRYVISNAAWFRPDLWFWVRAIYGSKLNTWLFYFTTNISMKVSRWWNKRISKMAFEPEGSQDEWVLIPNSVKPKIIINLAKLLYPTYALHIQAWQLYLMPDSKKKRKLQKICLDICPAHNYVIQMLLGANKMVLRDNVFNYKSMRGGRWTGSLNPWINCRDMNIITDPKRLTANVQDVDYVRKLYNTIQCRTNI